MVITNRNGFYNEAMFKEMEQFAQYQKKTDPWRQSVQLLKGTTVVAELEDLRAVFNTPGKVQIKCRVAKSLADKVLKKDTVKIKITSKGPLKEPDTIYAVKEWFEPLEGLVKDIEDVKEVYLTDNKWLYVRAEEE